MKIKILEGQAHALVWALIHEFDNSRFNVDYIKDDSNTKTQWVIMGKIRLKNAKEYCGQHSGACQIEKKNRKAYFLEGADWVEVDDMINDVLDALSISADIQSMICVLRTGRKRRIRYTSSHADGEWDKVGAEEDYEDWCGKIAPNSEFAMGTPGLYLRNPNTVLESP